MRRGILAIAGVAMLAACTHVDDQALARLQAGKATVAEAISTLGSPDRDETLPDGSRMLSYICSRTLPKPATALPGLVYAWGGWDGTSDEAGLMFAPDGILRFTSWSSNTRTDIKVVGRDIVAPKAPEPQPIITQDPPPVSEKGASPSSHNHSAD